MNRLLTCSLNRQQWQSLGKDQ